MGSYPFRIELFGDEIDRMEIFDAETQRMVTPLDRVELAPARELLLDDETRCLIHTAISTQIKKSSDERAISEMRSELLTIDNGAEANFVDKYISLIYPERVCLLDYFSRQSTVIVRGTSACYDRIKAGEWHINQTVEDLLEGGTISSKYTYYANNQAAFDLFLSRSTPIHFDSLGQGLSGMKLGGMYNFKTKHIVSYTENLDLLCDDLNSYKLTGYRVIITAENEASARNLCQMLEDRGIKALPEAESGEYTIDKLPKSIASCTGSPE